MSQPHTLPPIDWATWQPTQRAVLLFIVTAGQILLIHKKLGLGAGKLNGPGGRIEPGESPAQAAVRELHEELRIAAINPREVGQLSFQFLDGLGLHVHVFKANAFTGTPTETDEAIPLWTPVDQIPYDRMWQDDALWIPLLLRDQPFHGYFLFDQDTMIQATIQQPPPEP